MPMWVLSVAKYKKNIDLNLNLVYITNINRVKVI